MFGVVEGGFWLLKYLSLLSVHPESCLSVSHALLSREGDRSASISDGISLYFFIPYASFTVTPTDILEEEWKFYLEGPVRFSAGSLTCTPGPSLFTSGFLHTVESHVSSWKL